MLSPNTFNWIGAQSEINKMIEEQQAANQGLLGMYNQGPQLKAPSFVNPTLSGSNAYIPIVGELLNIMFNKGRDSGSFTNAFQGALTNRANMLNQQNMAMGQFQNQQAQNDWNRMLQQSKLKSDIAGQNLEFAQSREQQIYNRNRQAAIDTEAAKEKRLRNFNVALDDYRMAKTPAQKRVIGRRLMTEFGQEIQQLGFNQAAIEADVAELENANVSKANQALRNSYKYVQDQFGEIPDKQASYYEAQRQQIAKDLGVDPSRLEPIPSGSTLRKQKDEQLKAQFEKVFDFNKDKWARHILEDNREYELAKDRYAITRDSFQLRKTEAAGLKLTNPNGTGSLDKQIRDIKANLEGAKNRLSKLPDTYANKDQRSKAAADVANYEAKLQALESMRQEIGSTIGVQPGTSFDPNAARKKYGY